MEKAEFLRQVQQVATQMAAFQQSGGEFLRSMPYVPDDDFEAGTVEAEIQGTLECLLGDDLDPALRKLAELESYLTGSQPSGC